MSKVGTIIEPKRVVCTQCGQEFLIGVMSLQELAFCTSLLCAACKPVAK